VGGTAYGRDWMYDEHYDQESFPVCRRAEEKEKATVDEGGEEQDVNDGIELISWQLAKPKFI